MSTLWENEFRQRMGRFEAESPQVGKPVSIKIRVTSGCFHREHSPRAYEIIDSYVRSEPSSHARFQEHESGPEVLAYAAATTAGLMLAKSVIDLIVVILKARADGIKKGDQRRDPLELIVRDVAPDGKVRQEQLLRFHPEDHIDRSFIGEFLNKAVTKFSRAPELNQTPKQGTSSRKKTKRR